MCGGDSLKPRPGSRTRTPSSVHGESSDPPWLFRFTTHVTPWETLISWPCVAAGPCPEHRDPGLARGRAWRRGLGDEAADGDTVRAGELRERGPERGRQQGFRRLEGDTREDATAGCGGAEVRQEGATGPLPAASTAAMWPSATALHASSREANRPTARGPNR